MRFRNQLHKGPLSRQADAFAVPIRNARYTSTPVVRGKELSRILREGFAAARKRRLAQADAEALASRGMLSGKQERGDGDLPHFYP